MADITLENALKSLNASVSENSQATDATIGDEYVELYNGQTGEAIDKQPLSKLGAMMVNNMLSNSAQQVAAALLNWKQDKYQVYEHGTSDTTFALTPNSKHVWGTVASLTLTLAAPTPTVVNGVTVDVVTEYYFQFDSGATPTTLSLPSSVLWNGDDAPTIFANTRYQINIEGNVATVAFVSLPNS